MVGVGGQGILTMGRLLVEAGTKAYPHAAYIPSYGAEQRGGPSECSLILSNEKIPCCILTWTQALVLMEPRSLGDYIMRLRAGGWCLIESSRPLEEIDRKDIKVVKVPAIKTAISLGDWRCANMVMLGAYLQTSKVIETRLLEEQIEAQFANAPKLLSISNEALKQGIKLADRQS